MVTLPMVRYGPLSCDFRLAPTNDGASMDEGALTQVNVNADIVHYKLNHLVVHEIQVTSCGLNFPAPDRITPARAAAYIWSW